MIVRLTGGLGNQMFQYAFATALKQKYPDSNIMLDVRFFDKKKIHSGYELKNVFSIQDDEYNGTEKAPGQNKLLTKALLHMKFKKRVTKKYFYEVKLGYYPDVWNRITSKYYLDGYWQSEKYFKDYDKDIISCFRFPDFTEKSNIKLVDTLKTVNSVALHVRRGDYLSASDYICLGTTSYYQKAIQYMKEHVQNPMFVVFSDDIKWCKEQLNLPDNTVFVDWNTGEKSFRDMQLMTCCKHNIIANSTFSWWGGWLNQNPGKIVIAPEHFFVQGKNDDSEIIPSQWLKM